MGRSDLSEKKSSRNKIDFEVAGFLQGRNIRRLRRYVFQAKLTLYLEKLWPRLWPFLIAVSLFMTAVLFDLLPKFPPTVHFVLLLMMGGTCLGLLARALFTQPWPGQIEALHRLETDSKFKDRPLSVLLDRPVHDPKNKIAQAIWVAHIEKVAKLVRHIRLTAPVSYLGRRDRYSLRALLIILLFLGAIEARDDYESRIERAFTPVKNIAVAQRWSAEIWVNQPEYTGLRPVFIRIDADQKEEIPPLVVAQNSQVILRIDGVNQRQSVSVSFGTKSAQMNRLNARSYSLETQLDVADSITFLQNRKKLFSIPVELRADIAPQIVLRSQEPQSGPRGHMNVAFKAVDDYGLSKARLEIDALDRAGYDTLVIEQTLSGTDRSSVFRGNFAAHPWAGREVIMTPIVRDNAEQQVYGKGIKVTLPERQFNHPLAKNIVALRQDLFEPSPAKIMKNRLSLDRILKNPEDFDHKFGVYFPLRVATDRMKGTVSAQTMAEVRTILWETAVHLDEGNAGNARNHLEMLSRQMFDMMQDPGKASDMEALFEQMRQSLERYMQHMSQTMPKIEGFEDVVASQDIQMVGQDEMQNILDRAREMMRAGNIEGAQAMLDQFKSMLSRLAMQEAPDPGEAKVASEIMKQLQKIQQDQQTLMDQTFQRVRSSDGPSLENTRQGAKEATEQKRLTDSLDETIRKMRDLSAQSPQNLQDAHSAMKRASEFLQSGRDESAIQAQSAALEKLIEGVQQSAQQMAQQLGIQSVSRQLPGYDPMGRGRGGQPQGDNGFELPSQSILNKSREVLKELYRRAGQKGRTQQELEYIERLLEPF